MFTELRWVKQDKRGINFCPLLLILDNSLISLTTSEEVIFITSTTEMPTTTMLTTTTGKIIIKFCFKCKSFWQINGKNKDYNIY